ncbi:MAG: hypothetical protein PHE86_05355 [Candidatus Marinimicrobia bacterium]|nr:hypothetical protein [Candidatus Neomarinimicrobiota bacterium]
MKKNASSKGGNLEGEFNAMVATGNNLMWAEMSSEELEDLLLQKKIGDYIITAQVDALFENVMTEILDAGGGFSSKEAKKMSLYKRKGSPYYYVSLTYGNLPRIRRSTCCENKRDAEKVKLHLLLKMMNLVPASNQSLLCPTVTVNPVRNIDPLPEENFRDRVLSPEEEKMLLSCIDREWLRDITTFALLSGLRIGELSGLRKSNFHMTGEIPYFKIRQRGLIARYLSIDKHMGGLA